ncbi:MAG: heparinase II/III domain-containing protein [Candidatus Zhuqueibacterota bacterium]
MRKFLNSFQYNMNLLLVAIIPWVSCHRSGSRELVKKNSVFYSPRVVEKMQRAIGSDPWAADVKTTCLENARPWLECPDEKLWSAMFGPTISRTWMVWSNGYCPSCKKSVPMYTWKVDPLRNPWKVQCPHCAENFPRNDFLAFYQSGLDEHGVFDPQRGDRSLLFNSEHSAVGDSLRTFGVDDGEGYVNGPNRWRFIGAYLIHGQWKRFVYDGILNLALAYLVSQDSVNAHKAGILLDRVADLYPGFDFVTQGYSYERQDPILGHGYISVWHDACAETREMALAYDAIFDALKKDKALVSFLAEKARQHKLANAKSSFQLIQKNIEDRIFSDALQNRHKIESNFPQTEITQAIIETVLHWPEQRSRTLEAIDAFISPGLRNDGLSGEKGLAGYAVGFPRSLAQFLSLYNQIDEGLLKSLFERRPGIQKAFRFHVDTWVDQSYYPKVGDTGVIGQKDSHYVGAQFLKKPMQERPSMYAFLSMYSFFWKLFELTNDTVYVQILFRENESNAEGLPFDLLCDDQSGFQARVQRVIDEAGENVPESSVNKTGWCLGLLRAGTSPHQRTVWLDYDVGGNHCHADGMNMGLFAYGLDMIPGFGYPPVQFGGWHSPRAIWYRKTAAHNTVVVDGMDQIPHVGQRETEPLAVQLNPEKRLVRGKTTLWAVGEHVQAIRATGPDLYGAGKLKQYERMLMLVDISENASYVLDVFRVVGGSDHAKFLHGHFGTMETTGLNLSPHPDFGMETQMRNFNRDANPASGWSATWRLRDVHSYLPDSASVFLRYFDLTRNAAAFTAETWVAFGFNDSNEAWLPSLVVRNHSDAASLATNFVGILEPFETAPLVRSVKRYDVINKQGALYSDMNVALEVELVNGSRDILVSVDAENPLAVEPSCTVEKYIRLPEWDLETDAALCFIRLNRERQIQSIAIAGGSFVNCAGASLSLTRRSDFFEIIVENGRPIVLTGDEADIEHISL